MPCSVNLKVNNATKTKRFNRVELRTLCSSQTKQQSNIAGGSRKFHSSIWKDVIIVSKPVNEMTHPQLLVHWNRIRHPKEGRFNSHCVNLRFPLSAPSHLRWWPTLINVFWVQRDKGEYRAFRIGGVLSERRTLEWKLRMKVGFHHKCA